MSAETRVSSQEFLGIVSTRLAHRLSNHLAALAGSLAIFDSSNSSPEERAEALETIREAGRQAGELLNRFSELTQSLRPREGGCALGDLLSCASDWVSSRAEWSLQVDSQISNSTHYFLAGPWKWMAFALDAIADGTTSGEITVQRGGRPPGPPLFDGFAAAHIAMIVTTNRTELINWHDHREALKSWNLAGAYELLQYFGARPTSKILPDTRQQTIINLPLFDSA